MIYLHQLTYPEVLASSVPVYDLKGALWGGPTRTGYNAPHPKDLWDAWKSDVTTSNVVPQPVQAYYSAVKEFERPPRKPEDVVLIEQEQKAGVVTEPFRFTWSFSQLNQFETCPYQWAAERYYKTAQRQDTEATLWGSRVHKQLEDYVNSDGQTPLPEMGAKYAKALVAAKRQGMEVICEFQMGLDERLHPCEWDKAWAKGVIDFVIIYDGKAKIGDYKTGARKK